MTHPPSTPPPGFGNQPMPNDGSYPTQPYPPNSPAPPGYGYQNPPPGSPYPPPGPPYPPPGPAMPYGMPPPQKSHTALIVTISLVGVLLLGGGAAAFLLWGNDDSTASVSDAADSTETDDSDDSDDPDDNDDAPHFVLYDLNVSHLQLDGWANDRERVEEGYASFYTKPENYDFDSEFGVVIGAAGPLEDQRELDERATDAAINFTTEFLPEHLEVSVVSEEPTTIGGYDAYDAQLLFNEPGESREVHTRTVILEMDVEVVAFIGFTNQDESQPIHQELTQIMDSIEPLG